MTPPQWFLSLHMRRRHGKGDPNSAAATTNVIYMSRHHHATHEHNSRPQSSTHNKAKPSKTGCSDPLYDDLLAFAFAFAFAFALFPLLLVPQRERTALQPLIPRSLPPLPHTNQAHTPAAPSDAAPSAGPSTPPASHSPPAPPPLSHAPPPATAPPPTASGGGGGPEPEPRPRRCFAPRG
jgi:hypothetical protein